MEREMGSSLAPPIFLQPSLPRRCCDDPPATRKRDVRWKNPGVLRQNPNPNWNPNVWDWDSVGFSAKPLANAQVGPHDVHDLTGEDEGKIGEEEEDARSLTLKLAGADYPMLEARHSKRIRSESPAAGTYPACQVDDCKADLSIVKDYHRRHKVCEHHSKANKAIVGKQIQRFCQQCSRFHLLSEFDEGKRSCRRRLAGHNRRRRKTQREDMPSPSHSSPTQDHENDGNVNFDLINLINKFAQAQAIGKDQFSAGPSIPNREQLIQILSKLKTFPCSNSMFKLLESVGLDLNATQISQKSLIENSSKASGNPSCSSRNDSCMAVSGVNSFTFLSRLKSDGGNDDKFSMARTESKMQLFPSTEVAEKTSAFQPFTKSSKRLIHDVNANLSLQLFSSGEDNCAPKSSSPKTYFSSESSNPTTDTTPSSSPPVMHTFLQLNSKIMNVHNEILPIGGDGDPVVCGSASFRCREPLDLFKDSKAQNDHGRVQDIALRTGYISSSGSDHSPSTTNSDDQERTGRIIFKLFDKDPSNFPSTLRTEILNWLSNRPSEMESYIRPGCVVLSIYLCMLTKDWEQLEEEFLRQIFSLVNHSESGFWRDGKFLVQANRQIASHRDGKIRVWRTLCGPELISVTPVAIVSGCETTLLLRGHNLQIPGTRIHCAYKGGYTTTKEVLGSSGFTATMQDDCSFESFDVHILSPSFFGRCFIEVENGFKGNSFPVIIANSEICQELRILESEFKQDKQMKDVIHFLNELGWLFQKKNDSSNTFLIDFSTTRFKFLLIFVIERDWLVLTRTLLDVLVQKSLKDDGFMHEALGMLSVVQLLSQAVRRKCQKMIHLLLRYSVQSSLSNSKIYLFPPNILGPGGLTPLHLAASIQNSEEIVDELTNDPQEIGLSCWESLKDENGQTPSMYASITNNHSYNSLVARKLGDRKNGQISISVESENTKLISCARCAFVEKRLLTRTTRNHGLLQHPFAYPMLAIAAVCVCVCLFYRGAPQIENPEIGLLVPFKWENLEFGPT